MTAPVLSWVNLPGYYTKGVSPDTGQSGSTEFAFEVSYANATAYQPATGYPKLHIIQNGLDIISSPFIMNLQNGNVSSGQTYSYTTTLPDGSYSYYFEAMDSQNNLAVGDPLTINSGPVASSVLPASVSSELINNVHAYPIPALIGKGEKISFTALPPNATVTIMAPDGHILKKLHPGTGGIIAPWDGRTDDGNFLASGVYIVHARDSFGNKKIFSIAIVR